MNPDQNHNQQDQCPHPDKEAVLSWVNPHTGYQSTGPVCGACLAALWNQLSKFPNAVETATIKRVDG